MNKLFFYSFYMGLILAVFSLGSCQKEHEELSGENPKAIKASSSTGQLIQKASAKNGSYDDVVDGASCFAINFPYVVHVNGQAISINSMEELDQIEEMFDDMEDDVLDLVFPVTITLSDYSEITIGNEDEFEDMVEDCLEGGDDDDIECVDFIYPLTVYSFDINLQQTGKIVVGNDMELRRYFSSLDDDDLLSFDFPISLKLYDDSEVSVNNNEELAAVIEDAKDMCDDDDDDFTQERLEEYLVECPWLIREVERDDVNRTDQYFEYLMNFKVDGTVTVKDREGNVLNGGWSTRVSDHGVLLKLKFDVLVDFSLEWFVYELGEGKIKLFAEGGNRIIMTRGCDIINDDPHTLRDILRECSWIIKKVKVDGDEIRRLLGYEFKFMSQGVVSLGNGDVASEGTWEIKVNAQGRLVMAIILGQEPGVSFEWPLADLRDDRLKFEIPGTDYELILQRDCNGNEDGDVQEIRNFMMVGEWMVAKYSASDMDETANYAAYTFAFQAENMLNVRIGETGPTLLGSWRVLRNSDSKLKVYLNVEDKDPLGALTDDWEFVSITTDRLELRDNRDDSSGDLLVFEKN
ncbi:hypothetical protein K8352_03840 [Flavobacteriaceae bacterium F89]|uniref:Uncharacterized protein n=1 Tax=Cerina litoralis TaxID=2874477 RepID=A0AAE3JQ55_9FLAO|nr:hypothetical protein [Cerina litoralis]MCG2459868.1 hypothetical protein [Cerina litoralis]